MMSDDEGAELLFDTDPPDVIKSGANPCPDSPSRYGTASPGPDSADRSGTVKPPRPASGRRPSLTTRELLLAGVIAGSCLMAGCLLGLMIPFFPTEAARRGITQTTVSGVFSCFSLTQLVSTPLAVRAIPRLGVTRVLHLGLATAASTTLVFGALVHIPDASWFIAACFLTRLVEAAGAAAITTACFTMVAGNFGEHVSLMTGLMETLTACGLALAPAIGGLLFGLGGYQLPFYTLGGVMLLLLAASVRLHSCSGAAGGTAAADPLPVTLQHVAQMASSAENWLCCTVAFSMAAAWSASDSAVAVYALRTLQLGPAGLGLFLLAATGCYAATSLLWGWLAGRTRHVYLLMSGCLLCSAAGGLLMPPSPLLGGLRPARGLLLAGMLLQESFQAGAYLPCFPRMLQATQRAGLDASVTTQALVSGAFWTSYSLGDVVGPTVGGLLADLYGYPVMMTCFSTLTFLVCLCTLAMAVIQAYRTKSAHTVAHTDTHPVAIA